MCVGCVLVSVGGGSILHKEEPGSQGYAISWNGWMCPEWHILLGSGSSLRGSGVEEM